jgi:hypothetical protein
MTSLCSANTLAEFIMSWQNLCGGIYNELAKSMKSLCSANTLAEFIMSLQNLWRHFAEQAWAKCDR